MNKGMGMMLEAFRHETEYLFPSEIAEKKRVLSSGKYKGAFKFKRSPYARELVDTISPMNTKRVIGVEKGSQIGWTMAALANMMLAVFYQYQGEMLFMSDTDEQVKRAMNGFIDDMIRESGVGDVIGKKSDRTRRKSGQGDTAKEKKFGNGHTLHTWSGQVVGKLSSISPQYSFNDECERYKYSDKKGGSPYSLIMNRHKTYSGEYKAYFGSTPELEQMSVIHPIFLQGDQRYYMLPCPHCGDSIDFKFRVKLEGNDTAGIYYKRDKIGSLVPNSVGYICQKCGGFFTEKHKIAMYNEVEYQIANGTGMEWVDGDKYRMKNGEDLVCQWVPTATPLDPDYGSYHISALYSGAGFHTWDAIVKGWLLANPINAPIDVDQLRTFYNQELGLPWKEKARQTSAKVLQKNTRHYAIGVIPKDLSISDGNKQIVALTVAVDLNGKMGQGEKVEDDDVRLDYEVRAWCENGDEDYVTSYSIDHGSVGNFERRRDVAKNKKKGKHTDKTKWTYRHGYENNVWDWFTENVLNKDWDCDDGTRMRIQLCGVDTGNFTIYANEYVDSHELCIALKGKSVKYTMFDTDKAYFSKGSQVKLYNLEGDRLKDKLADSMELPWDKQKAIGQPQGYINFPKPEGDKYRYNTFFHEFEGERRDIKKDTLGTPVGIKWNKKHATSPNHFWDTALYNSGLQKIMTFIICKELGLEVSWKNYCEWIKNR